jgi:acyl-homoserine lactone synthase
MIQLVTSSDRPLFEHELAQMFRERKKVFVDRLGWEVPVVDGEFEIDQFDTEDAVYLLAADSAGVQLGSCRLLPTTGPHLLGDVFPHLCERGVPRGEDVWEITRMCTTEAAMAAPRPVRQRLMIAMVEFALLYGIKRFTLVSHLAYVSSILASGLDCEPLGLPQQHGDQTLGALAINVTPETLAFLRRLAGVAGPQLRWEVRDAA